jgi:hypothetical protein
VSADHADSHGGEGRLLGGGVEVDGLQGADLGRLGIEGVGAAPIRQILRLEHAGLLLQKCS